MAQHLKIATLDEAASARLARLEKKLGKHMMAFEDGPPFASLGEEDLAQIRALEEELGVLLLVYEA